MRRVAFDFIYLVMECFVNGNPSLLGCKKIERKLDAFC